MYYYNRERTKSIGREITLGDWNFSRGLITQQSRCAYTVLIDSNFNRKNSTSFRKLGSVFSAVNFCDVTDLQMVPNCRSISTRRFKLALTSLTHMLLSKGGAPSKKSFKCHMRRRQLNTSWFSVTLSPLYFAAAASFSHISAGVLEYVGVIVVT